MMESNSLYVVALTIYNPVSADGGGNVPEKGPESGLSCWITDSVLTTDLSAWLRNCAKYMIVFTYNFYIRSFVLLII